MKKVKKSQILNLIGCSQIIRQNEALDISCSVKTVKRSAEVTQGQKV